jgi:hypothetical protein
MPNALDRLVDQRSRLAEDVRSYYLSLIDRLDRTPWLRRGRLARPGEVGVPISVIHKRTNSSRSKIAHVKNMNGPAPSGSIGNVELAAFSERSRRGKRPKIRWNNEEMRSRRAIIVGPPGSGKSFLADKTVVDVARSALAKLEERSVLLDELPVPFHVDAAQLAGPSKIDDAIDLLRTLINGPHALSHRLASWFRNALETARGLVVIDGIDQVYLSPGKTLHSWLEAIHAQLGPCRILLTCRTANYDRHLVHWKKFDRFEMAPFGKAKTRRLVEQWFGPNEEKSSKLLCVLSENRPLRMACRNPLVATLVCVADAVTGETRPADLYDRVLRDLLRKVGSDHPRLRDDARVDDLMRLLERIVSELLPSAAAANVFTNSQLIKAISTAWADPHTDPNSIRDELTECGVLVSHGWNIHGELQFRLPHQDFLVYLAHFRPVPIPAGDRAYVVRQEDDILAASIANKDFVTLVSGPRYVGKTSLVYRAKHQAEQSGMRVVYTSFQKFQEFELKSQKRFLIALTKQVAKDLELDVHLETEWDSRCTPNVNLENYVREHAVGRKAAPLLWVMEDVDKLFPCEFSSDFFLLFRSWHEARGRNPTGAWSRLVLVFTYATEAHLYIRNIHESLFNVGTRVPVSDFTRQQVQELNAQCGRPLKDHVELDRFYRLLGGQPYLTNRGLHEIGTSRLGIEHFEEFARKDDGYFGDHLRRIRDSLNRDGKLLEALRVVLRRELPQNSWRHPARAVRRLSQVLSGTTPRLSSESFKRLRSAGVLSGSSERNARLRCELYAKYFSEHLL